MGRMSRYLAMIKESKLHAPNLKNMTLQVYTGNANYGNMIARQVVRDHLLGLRWMNPNAAIYLREEKGQGVPSVDMELWVPNNRYNGKSGEADVPLKYQFEIKGSFTSEEVVAKVLMAARDPDLDEEVTANTSNLQ